MDPYKYENELKTKYKYIAGTMKLVVAQWLDL